MQRATQEVLRVHQHSRGITLVELMVTISIFVILLAVAMPSLARFINDTRVSSATNEFTNAVNLARSEAIKRGRLVTICRSANAEDEAPTCSTSSSGNYASDDWGVGWLVYVEKSANTKVGSFETGEEIVMRRGAFPEKIYATNSSKKYLTFNSRGEPVGMAGFGINWNFGGALTRQICMSRSGRVRVIKDVKEC